MFMFSIWLVERNDLFASGIVKLKELLAHARGIAAVRPVFEFLSQLAGSL